MRAHAALMVIVTGLGGCGLVEEHQLGNADPKFQYETRDPAPPPKPEPEEPAPEPVASAQEPEEQAPSEEPRTDLESTAFDAAEALNNFLSQNPIPETDPIVMDEHEEAPALTPSEREIAAQRSEPDRPLDDPAFQIQLAEAEPVDEPDPPTIDERIDAMTEELAELLQQRAAVSPDQYQDLVKVAMLEGMALHGRLDELLSDGASTVRLTPDERRSLEALRDLLAQTEKPDAEALASAAREASEQLEGARPMRITDAALCSRVLGFGRYERINDSYTFVAGYTYPMIVYVEIDGFAHAPVTEDGREANADDAGAWAVELSQELNLYHGSDDRPIWSRSPQGDLSRSARKVRDYYLIQEIDLPANLSVGAFKLKVTVRDKVGGSVDEAILPIRVIADPRARR